ncbi:MAG TPA: hypothetical protein VFB00_10575 [Terriglobales bacterium]|nr:hypothetical protein [Terriglobales bacterium]
MRLIIYLVVFCRPDYGFSAKVELVIHVGEGLSSGFDMGMKEVVQRFSLLRRIEFQIPTHGDLDPASIMRAEE